jgi:hypothetical protein
MRPGVDPVLSSLAQSDVITHCPVQAGANHYSEHKTTTSCFQSISLFSPIPNLTSTFYTQSIRITDDQLFFQTISKQFFFFLLSTQPTIHHASRRARRDRQQSRRQQNTRVVVQAHGQDADGRRLERDSKSMPVGGYVKPLLRAQLT